MINLGTKIKSLRKEKNISQEVLANHLGLTAQAVSKWEQGVTLPDVELIPAIASYFGVSTDELFDFNLQEVNKQVIAICDEAYKFRFSDTPRSRQILRDGLKRFPGNEIILNNLLYTLEFCEEEQRKEFVEVGKNLIETSKDDATRFDALRMLASCYSYMGNDELVKETLDKLPEIYFTKLELQACMLKGYDRYRAASIQKNLSAESLVSMLICLYRHYRDNNEPEKAKVQLNIALKIIDAFKDDFCDRNFFKCTLYEGLQDAVKRVEERVDKLNTTTG
ncbi:MAG: helix-turn-helix transcriptional regulator [Clostridia bacterium]|nr:helix-turn-helix transcriptional regulator [Clostridia bacterium]